MSRNRVVLSGTFVGREELRYTPAGLPALNFRIAHESEQLEAARPRTVVLEIGCVALGEMAQALSGAATEGHYQFEGFLALRSRQSRQTVLHVTKFEIERS